MGILFSAQNQHKSSIHYWHNTNWWTLPIQCHQVGSWGLLSNIKVEDIEFYATGQLSMFTQKQGKPHHDFTLALSVDLTVQQSEVQCRTTSTGTLGHLCWGKPILHICYYYEKRYIIPSVSPQWQTVVGEELVCDAGPGCLWMVHISQSMGRAKMCRLCYSWLACHFLPCQFVLHKLTRMLAQQQTHVHDRSHYVIESPQ